MKFCGKCGNGIPEWAHGICPICKRIEYDYLSYDNSSTNPNFNKHMRMIHYSGDEWEEYGRPYLDSFNRFLGVVYDSEMRFSTILNYQGVEEKQILFWKQDLLWVISFLERLERRLRDMLIDRFPALDPRILMSEYFDDWNVQSVVAQKHISKEEFGEIKAQLLVYLRSKAGKQAFEMIVITSANETL